MFKYSMSALLLICLIPFSASATRELKGLRGTVCVKEVTQNPDGTVKDVTLAIEDGCDFKLKKTNGTLEQEITVAMIKNDLKTIYGRLGIILFDTFHAIDEYILEFDVKGVCPFKQIPSICITPETNIESLAKTFSNELPEERVALTSSFFAVTQVSKDTFRIRLYFTLAGLRGDLLGSPSRVIGNFLKIFLEGSTVEPESDPFCIHFIAADKPCKRRKH